MHGGDIYTEGVLKGKELIDFSSNINSLGLPQSFKDNLEEENLVLGNGAVEIIDLAISNLKSISILIPSFVEYELCAKKWNVKIDYCNLNEEMTYNYESIKKSLEKTEGIILGNPNNPNGSVIDKEEFIEKSINYIEKERTFMYENLKKYDLFHSVYSTYSNFILCKLKDIAGEELKKRLLEKGFVLRVCTDFKNLNNNYVRFAIKTTKVNEELVNILKETNLFFIK